MEKYTASKDTELYVKNLISSVQSLENITKIYNYYARDNIESDKLYFTQASLSAVKIILDNLANTLSSEECEYDAKIAESVFDMIEHIKRRSSANKSPKAPLKIREITAIKEIWW